MTGMARREIAIYLQNVVGCLEFLIKHLSFWHNQIFEPLYIDNENEEQVYNKMYNGKWW